ncbi:MAG: cupin domain-containing protein [Candidatus Binatia bacterium]
MEGKQGKVTREDSLLERQKAYSTKIHDLHITEGWWWDVPGFKPRPDQPVEPTSPVVPHIWRWSEVRPLLLESGELVGLGQGARKAERRVLVLQNPGMGSQYAITNTYFGDLQLIKPGEAAPSHRHTTTAARFVFDGSRGWTTVEGERVYLSPGDIVLNPQWAWHDHGNDGPDDFLFFDVLDIPLLTALATATWDFDYVQVTGDAKKTIQDLTVPDNYSRNFYTTGGIVPRFVHNQRKDQSPLIAYRWQEIRETLNRLRSEKGSPYDGILVEFTNPENGGPIGPTMSACAQLLPPGGRTLSHRHNTSTVYIVAEGQGCTEVNGARIEWAKNDIFAVPSWHWHEHVNDGGQDAYLYSVTDSPVVESLGLYREQRKTPSGEIDLIGWVANKYVER